MFVISVYRYLDQYEFEYFIMCENVVYLVTCILYAYIQKIVASVTLKLGVKCSEKKYRRIKCPTASTKKQCICSENINNDNI